MLELPTPPWTHDHTERWLSEDGHALPEDFKWPHRDKLPNGDDNLQIVLPSYRLSKGYGFWLHYAPAFPGLFEEIHAILLAADTLPDDGATLAALLNARRSCRGIQAKLF